MNKDKHRRKIFLKHYQKASFFQQSNINFFNDIRKILTLKVNLIYDKQAFNEYVRPLDYFNNDCYMLMAQSSFTTNGFKHKVDILFLNNNLEIVELHENLSNNVTFDFNYNFFNVLVLNVGTIKHCKINAQTNIKLSSNNWD